MAEGPDRKQQKLPLQNFSFSNRGNSWLMISGAIILIGLISLLFQGLNLSVDFTGGSVLEVDFETDVTTSQVEEVVADYPVMSGGMVQQIGSGDDVFFRLRAPSLPEEERREQFYDDLGSLGDYEILMLDEVSPTIGQELTRAGLLAIAVAILGMIAYITIRFEYRFAVCAIAALLHDAVLTLGIFSILQIEINAAFIAALLTIVGYSVNDTIVIFDRVRENLRYRKRSEGIAETVDVSIRQSLMRTLATSLTTFAAVGALWLFGGENLRNFTFALLLGVLVGTYSSLFIASPLWVKWQRIKPGRLISNV